MRSILGNLFYQHYLTQEKDKDVLQCLATNTGMLKKDFTEWQKRRFLDIIDAKDFLAYGQAEDSFAQGVRYGVLFMMEVFKETDQP